MKTYYMVFNHTLDGIAVGDTPAEAWMRAVKIYNNDLRQAELEQDGFTCSEVLIKLLK